MNWARGAWTAVGWQHIYIEVPEEWSIGAVSGNHTTGYLRLDDAEMPRVEVRWEPVKGNESVDKVVDRYLNTLVKKSRKKAPPVKIRRNLTLLRDDKQLEDRTVQGFHWKTEGDDAVQAYGILWRCEVCGRTVFIQILGRLGETVQPTATRVLGTLKDHPDGDTATWAAYGMRFDLPAGDVVKDHKFLTGHLSMRFTGDGDEIEVERYSLAKMQLDGETFESWYDEKEDGEVEERNVLPEGLCHHSGAVTSGTTVDPATANQRLGWLPWRRPKRIRFERCGWHCPDGNKLYLVRRIGKEPDRDRLIQVAQTLKCH